jgi:hypothetical protein
MATKRKQVKKQASAPKRAIGRPRNPPYPRVAVTVQATPEWREWLFGFAAATGRTISDLSGVALADLAKRLKFEPPPPRKPDWSKPLPPYERPPR